MRQLKVSKICSRFATYISYTVEFCSRVLSGFSLLGDLLFALEGFVQSSFQLRAIYLTQLDPHRDWHRMRYQAVHFMQRQMYVLEQLLLPST